MTFVRVLIASLLGAVVVFAWGAVSHMALPIGDMGVKPLPSEAVVLGSIKRAVPERGAYLFPSPPRDEGMSAEEMAEATERWKEAYAAGPRGMLIFDPSGDDPMSPRMLGIEFLGGLMAAFVASMLCVGLRAPYVVRVLAIGALGVFAWLAIDVSYWNWYRFPDEFALMGLIDQAAGWLLAGVPIAAIARPSRRKDLRPDESASSYPTMISRAQ